MSGGFATRGPGPSYAPGYGGAQSRLDDPEPATPAQRDADQAYAEEVRAAQLLQDARDLAGASPHEWATRRDELARRVEALASTRTSPAFASPEGDASRQRTAAALVEARRILGSARQPRAVPAVAGEEAIEGRISDKSAAPDEVMAWLTRLSLDERKVVLRRYEAVSGGGHKNSPDRFAVDLANYFAAHRGLARELHRLATQSQKQAAMARAQLEEREAAAAAEALPVAAPLGRDGAVGPAPEQGAASGRYLGEYWQELRLAVRAEFSAKLGRWLDPRLAWGIDADALAAIAIDGLLPTMYMPGTLENLVESLDDLVSNARAVGRQPGERADAWNPAVGRAIGRDLEDDLGRAARTMSANYARAAAGRRGRSPHDVLHPTTRYEQLAVDLLERGKAHLVAHPAAKPAVAPTPTPTPAEREAVLGPAVEVGPAPEGELTFEPASPIPTDVDAHEAQRATLRNAGAAQGYAAAGGAGGALAIDTASERFDQLDGSDPTRADLDARIDTFLLKLGTLSQNLDRTATSLFAGRATIGHFAGLGVVGTAEAIADRAQAVNAFVSRERKALTDRLSGVSDPGARQRLLAAAQHRIAASISQTQLVELSEQAVKALRDIEEVAQWTSVVMTLVISIAASFVAAEIGAAISSSLLAALARTTMAGASLAAAEGGALVAAEGAALAAEGGAVAAAEGAAATAGATGGAKAVALLAGQLTEAAINAAFQSSVFGDDSSTAFAENLLTSLLAHGVSGGVGRVNKALERAGETGGAVKVGVGAMEISAGAGAGFGSQAIMRGGDAPSGADFAIQGVSIVFAHWLGRRIAKAKERLATSDAANATELQAQLDELMRQSDRLVAAGTAVDRAELVRLVATSREVLGAAEHPGGATPARRAKAAEPPETRGSGRAEPDAPRPRESEVGPRHGNSAAGSDERLPLERAAGEVAQRPPFTKDEGVTARDVENDAQAPTSELRDTQHLHDLRNGPPGRVRDASELTNADVADALNAQLDRVKGPQIDRIVGAFDAGQRDLARMVIARSSSHGSLDSMNGLRSAMEPFVEQGRALYTPGAGSLADNVVYLSSKQTFADLPGVSLPLRRTAILEPRAMVLLDEVVLARIKRDPAFAQALGDNACILLEPHGYTSGLNMFNAGSEIAMARKVTHLVTESQRLIDASNGSLEPIAAIDRVLSEETNAVLDAAAPELRAHVRVVNVADVTDVSNSAIEARLNGGAGISEAEVGAALTAAGLNGDQAAYARELLARESEILSHRRLSNDLLEQHGVVMAEAARRGVDSQNVYFWVPLSAKSYGVVAMAHRQATGVAADRYINGAAGLKGLGPDSAIVIFDDVAGTGQSLVDMVRLARDQGYDGQVIVSPVVSTKAARDAFLGQGGLSAGDADLAYLPHEISTALTESDFYLSLDVEQQKTLKRLIGDPGWGGNALAMSFPYMAPDNNSSFFGDLFARFFIVNNNRAASKAPAYDVKGTP